MDANSVVATETYTYAPLPEELGSIRLVRISTTLGRIADSYATNGREFLRDQSLPEDIFMCSIDSFSPADIPPYDTLSYTWGTPISIFNDEEHEKRTKETFSEQCPIICNGKVMQIGRNLYDALKLFYAGHKMGGDLGEIQSGLRLMDYIWIDALCIDQNNIAERNEQVKLMDQIYRRGEKCIVWLGDEESSVQHVLKVISAIGKSPALLANAHRFASSKPLETRDFSAQGLPAFGIADWISVFIFYSRSWFQRAWILQEAILAKNTYVFCGFCYVQWPLLAATAQFLSSSGWASDIISEAKKYYEFETNKSLFNTPKYISQVRHMLKLPSHFSTISETPSPDILSVLQDFRSANCKEPKDKIYAIRGIVGDGPASSTINKITVDYNLPDWQIYLELAWTILETRQNLDLLSHAGMSSVRGVQGLPSWTPDWSLKEPTRIIASNEFDGPNGESSHWNAAGGFHWKGQDPRGLPQTLVVQGKRIGSVMDVVRFTELGDTVNLLRLFMVLQLVPKLYFPVRERTNSKCVVPEKDNEPDSRGPISGETRFEALWRTMVMNCWRGESPAPRSLGHDFVKALIYTHMFVVLREGFMTGMAKRAQSWDILKELSLDEEHCVSAYPSSTSATSIDEEEACGEDSSASGPVKYLPVFTGSMQDGNWDEISKVVVEGVNESFTNWRHAQSSRSILVSDTGLLGLGLEASREGDELWVLAGARVPFVLRKETNGTYKVVGEAYVHGVMDGEALTSSEELEEIVLV